MLKTLNMLIPALVLVLVQTGCRGKEERSSSGRTGLVETPPVPTDTSTTTESGTSTTSSTSSSTTSTAAGTLQVPSGSVTPAANVTLTTVKGNVTSSTHGVAGSLVLSGGASLHGGAALHGGFSLTGPGFSLTTSNCASGTYTVKAVGGGADKTLKAATAFSNSQFNMSSIPLTDEVAIIFSCDSGGTVRCLAKPGDAGILCNAIADSVISAFEAALGKTIYDSSFKGRNISKVASAIVDSSKMSTTAVDTFKTAVAACMTITDGDSKKTCMKTAMTNSPFNASFQIMQQMAKDWDTYGLYVLATDILGLTVMVDSDLYMDLFGELDEAMGVTFVADTRQMLIDVITAQKAQTSTYPFTIQCFFELNQKKKVFSPDLNAPDASSTNQYCKTNQCVTCNQSDAVAILQNAGVEAKAQARGCAAGEAWVTDSSQCKTLVSLVNGNSNLPGLECDAPNNGNRCWVTKGIEAISNTKEKNRNDLDGTRRQERYENRVDLVDIMPQVMTGLSAAGFEDSNHGPPQYDPTDPAEVALMRATLKDLAKYFIGMMGVQRIMKDPQIKNAKVSLEDMHNILVGDDFLRVRIAAFGPGVGDATISDGDSSAWFPPVLVPNDSLGGYVASDKFVWGNSAPTITKAQAAALYEASKVPFADTFGMFTDLPDSKKIEDFAFNSSHHEEWNPMGQKFIYVAQLKKTGNGTDGTGKTNPIPIACKVTGGGHNFKLLSTTTVSCDSSATGVTCTEGGSCTFPDDYEYPFLLMERGWYGDNVGRSFRLASRTTGREEGGHSGGIWVKEYKSGNATGKCDASQVGTVIHYIEQFWCGPDTKCDEKVSAFCMDMSALDSPARKRFYPGGFFEVSNTDESGEAWSWQVPLIGLYDGSDHDNNVPLCLLVKDTKTLLSSSNSTDNLASNHVYTTGANKGYVDISGVTAGTEMGVASCASSTPSGFKAYRLFQHADFGGSDTMFAYLLDSNGKTMQWTRNIPAGQDWEYGNLKIKQTDIDTLIAASTVSGTVTGSAATQINGMRFLNPLHDARFDPYCDDINGNGHCDCYPVDEISHDRKTITYKSTLRTNPEECGLMDKTAEPTLSELPYCHNCGSQSDAAKTFMTTYGGKSGYDLAGIGNYMFDNGVHIDLNSLSMCKFKFTGGTKAGQNIRPRSIDWQRLSRQGADVAAETLDYDYDSNSVHDIMEAGKGCPGSEGLTYDSSTTYWGPIRIMSIKPMSNAFSIDRPNTFIKLINYATKSYGVGRTLDPGAKVFSLDEAMAMMTLRLMIKPEVKVFTPGVLSDMNNATNYQTKDYMTQLFMVPKPDDHGSSPFSSVLKGVMYLNGRLTLEEIQVQFGGGH